MENTTSVVNVTSSVDVDGVSDLILYFKPPRWSLNVELVLMAIVFIFGVPGNALIILVQAKTVNKTSTDYLVMIMAMYEFFGSSVITLVRIAMDVESIWMVVSSPFLCKLQLSGYNFGQYGAGQTLGALAVDRLIKTHFPLNSWYKTKMPLAISVCILLTTLAVSVPHVVIKWDPVSLQCAATPYTMNIGKNIGVVGSALMVVVFAMLSISYAMIAVSLRRRHIRKMQQHKLTSTVMTDIATAGPIEETTISDHVTVQSTQSKGEANAPSAAQAPKAKGGNRVLTLEGRNVNKLTILMFMISLFYVASNLLLWYLYATWAFVFGIGVMTVAYAVPMLNCITNPIMFFVMSSRFRKNVYMLLCHSK